MHPIPQQGCLLGGHPAPLHPPPGAFPPGTSCLGECRVGPSGCRKGCGRSCLRMLRPEQKWPCVSRCPQVTAALRLPGPAPAGTRSRCVVPTGREKRGCRPARGRVWVTLAECRAWERVKGFSSSFVRVAVSDSALVTFLPPFRRSLHPSLRYVVIHLQSVRTHCRKSSLPSHTVRRRSGDRVYGLGVRAQRGDLTLLAQSPGRWAGGCSAAVGFGGCSASAGASSPCSCAWAAVGMESPPW